jgi:hypothetical protein
MRTTSPLRSSLFRSQELTWRSNREHRLCQSVIETKVCGQIRRRSRDDAVTRTDASPDYTTLVLILTDNRSFRSEPVTDRPEATPFRPKQFPFVLSQDVVEVLDAGLAYNNGRPPETIRFDGKELPNPRKHAPPRSMLGAEQKAWFSRRFLASFRCDAAFLSSSVLPSNCNHVNATGRPVRVDSSGIIVTHLSLKAEVARQLIRELCTKLSARYVVPPGPILLQRSARADTHSEGSRSSSFPFGQGGSWR